MHTITLEKFCDLHGLTPGNVCTLLDISTRTYIRYKKNGLPKAMQRLLVLYVASVDTVQQAVFDIEITNN